MEGEGTKVSLFTLAGVLTAPHFLDGFRKRLEQRIESELFVAESHSLFPYGDWDCSRTRQLAEISLDLWSSSIGGTRAAKQILDVYHSGSIVMVGHSGGGVAAVQAGRLLENQGLPIGGMVMIGSPKLPLRAGESDAVLYIYGTDPSSGKSDPVTRLGRWGREKPPAQQAIPIIGGHRNYFRTQPPYVDREGRSNLQWTEEAVWAWMEPRIHRVTKR